MRRLSIVLAAVALAALAACASTPEPAAGTSAALTRLPTPGPDAFRATAPAPAVAPKLRTPTFEKRTLDNGLVILVVERHDLPLVSVNVAVGAGSSADPKGKAGLARISLELLLEGAGKRDALALDAAFSELGAAPAVAVTPDGALVGTTVLARNLDGATALLAEVVRSPRMDAQGFARRKEQRLADLAAQAGNPRFLASEAFGAVVFGEGHPYAHLDLGTPSSVGTLSLADAKAFWKEHATPGASALIVAGDLTPDQAVELARKHFGSWKGPARQARAAAPAAPDRTGARRLVLVPKAGLNQTSIYMGRPAIAAGHADEAALDLATTVFGGFFGSRLNMNLREAHGYSYGARASVDARRGVGPVLAASAVRADVTGPALKEFIAELDGLKSRPITVQELEAAREGRVRALPGRFERLDGLAAAASELFFEEAPLDRWQKLAEALEKATAADVQRVATTYLDRASMDVVLVGDPAIVEGQVPALGLGTLEQRAPLGAAPAKAKLPPPPAAKAAPPPAPPPVSAKSLPAETPRAP